MSIFIPKESNEESWIQLPPQSPFACRALNGDVIQFRLGGKSGVFLALASAANGRTINLVDYETGDYTPVGAIADGQTVCLGRTSECELKLSHAIVSRRHLSFTLKGSILVAQDEGSTNKSFISSGSPNFDINKYLEEHPLESLKGAPNDTIHEVFGYELDEFLTKYSQERKPAQ